MRVRCEGRHVGEEMKTQRCRAGEKEEVWEK